MRFTDYSNKIIDGKPAIWLQGYGWAEAKPASEFQVGDYMRWNGGSSSRVVEIVRETPKMVTVMEEWVGYGGELKRSERKLKKDRWVAIGSEESMR